MNLPNTLTLLRIFFVPLLVAALVQEDVRLNIGGWILTNQLIALAIFLVAALTDLVDGYLARRWGQVTTVGTLLDPIADKLLISAALISLVQVRRIPGWIAVLIIGREFAVSGLRSIAAIEGLTIRASELGKTKMVSQVIAVALILISEGVVWLRGWADFCLWMVVVFALLSAAQYFRKFWHSIDENVKARRRIELLQLERQRAAARSAAAGERLTD
jgi:CDP-diacylglycerol--glycerol-3-phosphate 3-phosphatidyltransferase